MRQGFSRDYLWITALVFLFACRPPEVMCPQWIVPPITVEVRDVQSGLPAAQGSVVTFRIGGQSATVRPAAAEQVEVSALGGPGTYYVLVQKQGYKDWARNGVRVRGNQCGVAETLILKANLEWATRSADTATGRN